MEEETDRNRLERQLTAKQHQCNGQYDNELEHPMLTLTSVQTDTDTHRPLTCA